MKLGWKDKAFATLIEFLIFCGILLIVQSIWVGLEIVFDGQVQPSHADTVIGIILVYSLYFNLRKQLRIMAVLE